MKGKSIWLAFDWLVRNIKLLGISLLGMVGVYVHGRRRGRQQAEDEHASALNERHVEALETKDEIKDEVARADRDELLDSLRNRPRR